LRATNSVERATIAGGKRLSDAAALRAAQAWHPARKLQSCAEIQGRRL